MNRVLLGIGVLAVLAGLGAIIDPDVLATMPSGPSGLIAVIGVLSLLEAVRAAHSRYARSVEEPSLPHPERRLAASVLEPDVDVRPSVGRRSRHAIAAEHDRIRDRLTKTAVGVLVRCDGDTPERARERLRTGSWTDDPEAAAFFAPEGYRQSLSERLGTLLTRTDAFQARAHSAIAALSERMDGQTEHGGTDE